MADLDRADGARVDGDRPVDKKERMVASSLAANRTRDLRGGLEGEREEKKSRAVEVTGRTK